MIVWTWFKCWVLGVHDDYALGEYMWGGRLARCKHCDQGLFLYEWDEEKR